MGEGGPPAGGLAEPRPDGGDAERGEEPAAGGGGVDGLGDLRVGVRFAPVAGLAGVEGGGLRGVESCAASRRRRCRREAEALWLIIWRFIGMAMKTPSIAMVVIQKNIWYDGIDVWLAIMSAGMAAAVPPPVM